MTPRLPLSVLVLGGGALVALLAVSVTTGASTQLDHEVMRILRDRSLAGFLSPLRVITELGSTEAVTVVAVAGVLLGVLIGPWLHGLIGALTIGSSSLGVETLKRIVGRTRPEILEPILEERGFSFPSGHATLSMVAWGILGVLVMRARLPLNVRRAIVAILAILVLLIGLSRIWLGVHYPTDVLAGWTAGAVVVLVYARLTRRVSPEPAAAAVDADPTRPRSGPPAAESDAPPR